MLLHQHRSPLEHTHLLTLTRWEVSVDQANIVLLEILNLGSLIALAVQIIRVESLDSLQHLRVLLGHHPLVAAGAVPWVERMVSNHSESLVGEGALLLADVVKVLIVSPREHDVVHTAAWSVDSVLGAVDWVLGVWVVLKGTWVDDGVIEAAADGEGVADDIPLTTGVVEEEQLPEVVD